MDVFPFRLDLPSQFANTSGVIEVEAASQSEENSVHSNSVSTLRANLSMLREAGVTSISCGSANTRSETYALNFSISELSWGGGGGGGGGGVWRFLCCIQYWSCSHAHRSHDI